MIVGVPKEIKTHEYRVGLLPVAIEELTAKGHRVIVQRNAGVGIGVADSEYERRGATLVDAASEVYGAADLIVKVKEPQPDEIKMLKKGQLVFTYFHLAASESLTHGLLESGATAIAYETLEGPRGGLPLLIPMSEIAGRMSIQQGAKYLERAQGGRGVLLSGVPGVERAHVTILGGGVVGSNAAKIAAGFGANVTILDTDLQRLRYLDDVMPANVTPLFSDRHTVLGELARADLVIGGVLVKGARAPWLVTHEDLKLMKPGAVVVDVSVDQGGCFETTHPTTHSDPVYTVEGIVHYAVANMPGAVALTSTYALTNATTPYALKLANLGLEGAIKEAPELVGAINIHRGAVTHPAVADTFKLRYTPFTL